ncbi:hypothetical protein GC167_02010 [bacterium]|nr:hypothetical protein [bacterium]
MKLGTVGKQGLLGGLSLYAGQILGLFNKLVLFPLVFLGAEAYWGLFEWFSSTAVLAVALGSLGVSRAWVRFAPMAGIDRRALVRISIVPAVLGLIALMVSAWALRPVFSDWSSDPELALHYYPVFFSILGALWLFDASGGILQAAYKAHWPLFANNVSLRLLNTAILLAFWRFSWPIEALIPVLGGAPLLNHGVLSVLAYRQLHRDLKQPISAPGNRPRTIEGWNAFRRYALWTSLSAHAMLQIDLFLVGGLLPLSQAALLGLSKNFTSAIETPARSISQASMAVLAEKMSSGDRQGVRSIYRKTSLIQFLAAGWLYYAMVVNLPWVLQLLPENRGYEAVFALVAITGLGRLVDAVTGSNTVILSNSDYYRFNLWSSIGSLGLMIGFQLWTIPQFGLVGAALGLALALSLVNAAKTLYLYLKTQLHPFDPVHWELLGLFALLGVAYAVFRPDTATAMGIAAANGFGLVLAMVYGAWRLRFWKALFAG